MSKIKELNNIVIFTDRLLKMNSYLICKEQNCVCVDPGMNCKAIKKFLVQTNKKLIGVVLTHGHFDHVGNACLLAKEYNITVDVHTVEIKMLHHVPRYAFMFGFSKHKIIEETIKPFTVNSLSYNDIKIDVIKTPGHTTGGVCFIYDKYIFTGDTLFVDSIGRTDLEGGSLETLMQSLNLLKTKIQPYWYILPGHGNYDTFDSVLKSNRYLK